MELTKNWVLSEVIKVLVVDHDSTSLKIVSQMLGVCGYEVVTANCGIDGLRIARERENGVHLILTEVHLPDMGRYEFLEKMEQISKLPIVVMSANDNEIAKLGCIFKGAMLYLVKPLVMKSVRNLWQFAFIKGSERFVSIKASNRVQQESINENESDENKENQSIKNEKKKYQKTKRKEPDEVSRQVEDQDGIDSTLLKKPKLIWTEQLHNRFLQAIKVLGIDNAHPKEILQHMNVPGLRKENISSHLQKFRLSLKRKQDATQKKILESFILEDESVEFPNQQLATNLASLSHFERQWQLPKNIGVFMAKAPFGQETQPSNNNSLPSTSINSNLIGSCEVVSFESLTNCNMGNSCFSELVIPNQTCSMNSTPRRPSEDQVEDRLCNMFKVDVGEVDGIVDIVKDFTMTLHDEDYDHLWQ